MEHTNVTVIGLQWGDEGKGKVVDAVARVCRYVVRFCGGANAGHSVATGGEKFALHLIPCGVFQPGVVNVIGNGVVFEPACAIEEIDGLLARDVQVDQKNLRISAAAQVVMPWHKQEDRLREQALGSGKIGTTARGIGPCYADKAHRSTAVRVGDLRDEAVLGEKIRRICEYKNRIFSALYDAEPLDVERIVRDHVEYGQRLSPMICDTGHLLRRAVAEGEPVLFEGGQGSLLDIDHGTYPFVTSSSVTACGVPSGTGIAPASIGQVVGVVKAYTSRVGAGPFPTEQDNPTGDWIRERGHEYGTTTGRPRRCGWFDAVAVRYAAELSGVNELALSLLDVLSGLEELKICTAYELDGQRLESFDPTRLEGVECVWETLEGWTEDLGGCASFEELPAAARRYVERIEEIIGRPVGTIGVGADREQTILHNTRIPGLKP
jgi:adenylosuccinate synthase